MQQRVLYEDNMHQQEMIAKLVKAKALVEEVMGAGTLSFSNRFDLETVKVTLSDVVKEV